MKTMESAKRSYSSSKSNLGKYKSDKIKDVIKSSSSRQKLLETDIPEQESTQAQLPVIKQIDVARILPKFTAILSRAHEDGVGMEDLDEIQQDFERLLSACSVRQRLLRSEVESMEKKGKPYDKSSLKRKRIDEKPKYKDSRNIAKIVKTKNTVPVNSFVNDLPVRYEQFWQSINTFCQDVSKEDVTYLDELILECSQDTDIKIPELGEHYAMEWTENGLQTEQNFGGMKTTKKSSNSYINEVKKNGLNNSVIDTFPSPLTQRLLDTLIEEKVIKQIPTVFDKLKCSDYTIKSNNGMRSGLCLDRRLRKELVEQGILDMEDLSESFPPEDEILLEIKKCQQELAMVNKHNTSELNKLRTAVAKDVRKQDVKAALDKVDCQVLNLYNSLKPNLAEFEQDATNVIKQQVLLHRELTDLTDFSLIE